MTDEIAIKSAQIINRYFIIQFRLVNKSSLFMRIKKHLYILSSTSEKITSKGNPQLSFAKVQKNIRRKKGVYIFLYIDVFGSPPSSCALTAI
jgi:hypothetical protein